MSAGTGRDDASGDVLEPRQTAAQRILVYLLVAAVAAVGLALLVTMVVAPAVRRQAAADVTSSRVHTAGLERVWWADSGRLAVVQDFHADGTPVVAVWDTATNQLKTASELLVLRIYAENAEAIVTPASAADVASLTAHGPRYPLVGCDYIDAPAPGARLLDLASMAESVTAPPWTLVEAPARGVVVPALGSGWSRTLVAPAGGAPALVPTPGAATVQPVGPASDGRHFALTQLLRQTRALLPRTRRLYVVEASAGVAATAALPATAAASWAATRTLVWPVSQGSTPPSFAGIDLSTSRPATFLANPAGAPAPLVPAQNSGPEPLAWSVHDGLTTFWRFPDAAGTAPLRQSLKVPMVATQWAWDSRAGLLGVQPQTGLETYRTVVYYLSPRGGSPAVIYKGEARFAAPAEEAK